jgi:hypothetical protein
VRRIVPALPTAVPVFAATKETPQSEFVVPLLWGVQVAPPSVVCRIHRITLLQDMDKKSHSPPTPVFTSTKETAFNEFVVH